MQSQYSKTMVELELLKLFLKAQEVFEQIKPE
jgi:hypothetical protein